MKIFLFILIFTVSQFSQPSWYSRVPEGYSNDFFVGKGTDFSSKTEAATKAFADAVSQIVKNGTVTVRINEQYTTLSKETFQNDRSQLEVIDKIARDLFFKGDSQIMNGLKEVEAYYETGNGAFHAWVLVSVPKKNPLVPPSPLNPVWRSALLPGWGQLYKDQKFKGVSFMILTLGSAASGFICNTLSEDATNKALTSRTQARRDFYNQQAKDLRTASTASFIATGVFYAWNLIDAIAVKDETLFVITDPDRGTVLSLTIKL